MRKNTPEQTEAKRLERNERNSEWRAMLKSAHICRGCNQTDAYTMAGHTYCAECAAKEAEKKQRWRENNPGVNAQRVRERTRKLREQGKCTKCGNQLTDSRYKICTKCRARARKYKAEQRTCNYPRGENGICWQCNKQPVKDGFNLCADCYEKKVAILQNLNQNRNNRNHVWRKYDHDNYKQSRQKADR